MLNYYFNPDFFMISHILCAHFKCSEMSCLMFSHLSQHSPNLFISLPFSMFISHSPIYFRFLCLWLFKMIHPAITVLILSFVIINTQSFNNLVSVLFFLMLDPNQLYHLFQIYINQERLSGRKT